MKLKLQIDGRNLVFPFFLANPATLDPIWPDGGGLSSNSTAEIFTYTFDTSLPAGPGGPGAYPLVIGAAVRSVLEVIVLQDGTMTMNVTSTPYSQFTQLQPGVWSLELIGYPLTLDARYLSTSSGLIFVNSVVAGVPATPWRLLTGNFLPASPDAGYLIEPGSGLTNWNVAFNVDLTGNLTYSQTLDVANGGPLQGAGGKVLEFLGFPILIDARAATAETFYVEGFVSSSDPNSDPSVLYLDLLPYGQYGLNSINGAVGPAFTVSLTGELMATATDEYSVGIDHFRGIPRLSIFRRLEIQHPLSNPIHSEMQMTH